MTHLALEMELLPRPGSPRAARHAVREALEGLDPGVLDAAELVVSELVTNAAQHAGGRSTIVLRISLLSPSGVRLEVADGSSVRPERLMTSADDTSGRGLVVVDALAVAWGVDPLPGEGKRVWCELAGGQTPVASG